MQGLMNDFRSGFRLLSQEDDNVFESENYSNETSCSHIDVDSSDSGSDVIVIEDDADFSDCQILEVTDSEAPLPSVSELPLSSQSGQRLIAAENSTYPSPKMSLNAYSSNRSMGGAHVNPQVSQPKRPLSVTASNSLASSAKKQHTGVVQTPDEPALFGVAYEVSHQQVQRPISVAGSAKPDFRKIEGIDDENDNSVYGNSRNDPTMDKNYAGVVKPQSNSSRLLTDKPADTYLQEKHRKSRPSHVARKTTGRDFQVRALLMAKKRWDQPYRDVISSATSPSSSPSPATIHNPDSRVAPADRKGKKKNAKKALKKNTTAFSSDIKVPQDILDAMKISEACINQAFLYDIVHTQLPCEADGIGSHCLSMAWQPAEMSKNADSLDIFISQGAKESVVAALHGLEDTVDIEEFSTCLFRCSVSIQRQRFRYTSPALSVNSAPSNLYDDLDTDFAIDRNFKPVTQLKLYDQGRVMFGCSMGSLMVWMTKTMKHCQSLLLIDDVNGVYDVGKNYVVAGSERGDVGVWKAGSKSHIWRYNDARRFENSRKTGYMAPEVSALRIAHGDDCAYVGDSLGSLSLCDFREPRVKMVSPIDRGKINSIDIVDNRQILVGTEKGIIATLDSRMMGGSYGTKVLNVYTPEIANPVRSIQVNPHNSSVIACSSNEDIRIYKADANGEILPVFTHSLHQSEIADYSWHPNREYKYTIGSLDTGEGFDTGEIQIWQPAIAKDW